MIVANDRTLLAWANMCGCRLSVGQEYCRNIEQRNRYPRGMRNFAEGLRYRILDHLHPSPGAVK